MNISLTPELMSIVQSKVDSGVYSDSSEVISEAVRRLDKDVQAEYQYKLGQLRKALEPGIKAVMEGDVSEYSYEELMRDMDNGEI